MFATAFLQYSGKGPMRHEEMLLEQGLRRHGILVRYYTIKRIHRRQLPLGPDVFIAGDMDAMHGAMHQLGIPVPSPDDYPAGLAEYLRRKVWTSTLGEVERAYSIDASSPAWHRLCRMWLTGSRTSHRLPRLSASDPLLPRSVRANSPPHQGVSMKPIGCWLNRTDRAFTTHMNAVLAEFALTRIAWQVLNVVTDTADTADADIHTVPAVNADRAALDAAIATTLTGEWAARPEPGRLALADHGRRRLAEVAGRIAAFRAQSMLGITDDEYRTAVSVLERRTLDVEAATA